MKVAVLSMDIEDWYHLDYFTGMKCDRQYSMMDGVDIYRTILAEHDVPSSFFLLGELLEPMGELTQELYAEGHELGVHGWSHDRPMTMDPQEFQSTIIRAKDALESVLGQTVDGYRAPCFSLDRERLDCVREAGFTYDSSRMPFVEHPLYGSLDMDGFAQLNPHIYRKNSFYEFQLSTLKTLGKNVPVSGGGYIRIFPWILMKRLIEAYLKKNDLYICYIHPFELSTQPTPPLPKELGRASRIRFGLGRASVSEKLSKLIKILKQNDFRFMTFSKLRESLMEST